MTPPKTIGHKFLNIEDRGGIFVILAVIGIITVAFFIGIQQSIFTPKVNIYFIANSGNGIKTGAKVVFNGFKIGKINNVNLEETGEVKAELTITSDYIEWIKKDSIARLTKGFAISDSIIEITPGSESAEKIEAAGLIRFERAKWFPATEDEINTIPISISNSPFIADMITALKNDLQSDTNPLLEDLKVTLKNFRTLSEYALKTDFQSDIKPALENVKVTLKNFRTLSEDALITRQYLDSMYKNADSNLNELNALVARLNIDIPEIIKGVNESLDNINLMATDFRKISIKAFSDIIAVIQEGAAMLDETEEIVDAVKQTWPISSKIKKKADIKEQIIKVDSYE